MYEDIVNQLISRNLTISFVETSTGGLITSKIIEVAGSSKVIKEAHILYSNESKIKYLGINEEIFTKFGAVSKECASSMAYLLKELTKADIVVSTTEIVGPTGGSKLKPVGTSYVAIIFKDDIYTYHQIFSGTRREIQQKIVSFVYTKLGELLNDY